MLAPVIVISPHLDDAVLSLGQTIEALTATGTPVTIVTVLAGVPGALPLTHYDAKSGFTSGEQAVVGRRAEDQRACTVLRARSAYLDWFDGQYGQPPETGAVIADLRRIVRTHDSARVFAPLGIAHPDHEHVARCARGAVRPDVDTLYLYEDLPSRVLYPEQVPPAFDRVTAEGWSLEPVHLAVGRMDIKRAAVGCYRSQFAALDDPCFFVPERVWLATPPEPNEGE